MKPKIAFGWSWSLHQPPAVNTLCGICGAATPRQNMVSQKAADNFTFKFMTDCEYTIIQNLRCTRSSLATATEDVISFIHDETISN